MGRDAGRLAGLHIRWAWVQIPTRSIIKAAFGGKLDVCELTIAHIEKQVENQYNQNIADAVTCLIYIDLQLI